MNVITKTRFYKSFAAKIHDLLTLYVILTDTAGLFQGFFCLDRIAIFDEVFTTLWLKVV